MLWLAIPLGLLFGFALYYAGATESKNIINMLTLKDLSLATIILGAIGLGSFVVGILGMFHMIPLSHFNIKPMNIGVILGGIMFGIGFGLIGSCPGTAVAALFTNFKKAIWIIIGGLTGALTFSVSYKYLLSYGLIDNFNFGKMTLFNLLSQNPHIFNIGFIGLVIFGILLLVISFLSSKINIK